MQRLGRRPHPLPHIHSLGGKLFSEELVGWRGHLGEQTGEDRALEQNFQTVAGKWTGQEISVCFSSWDVEFCLWIRHWTLAEAPLQSGSAHDGNDRLERSCR